MFADPPPSSWDLHFKVAGIPVRIHPMFWIVSALIGFVGPQPSVLGVLSWVVAVFVSVLVHELGHAVVARAYGWPPRVSLYGMGGLAMYTPTRRDMKSRIAIAFAGPGAGFLLAALVVGGVLVSGHSVGLPGLSLELGSGPHIGGGRLEIFIAELLIVNVFWGLVNLAPIRPLDGGEISAALLQRFRPRDAEALSLQLSVAAATLLAVSGLLLYRSVFMAVLFGFLGYGSWKLLQAMPRARPARTRH